MTTPKRPDDPRLPAYGTQVELSCGGLTPFLPDTPYAFYKSEIHYFCLMACKRTFGREPEKFLSGAIPHFEDF